MAMNLKPANTDAKVGGSRDRGRSLGDDETHQGDGRAKEQHAERGDRDRAYGVEQSAQRRPADHGHLVGGSPAADGAGDQWRGDEGRNQRAAGRHLEGARAADQEYDAEQESPG